VDKIAKDSHRNIDPRSVEAIGVDRVCRRIPPLPETLHSHFAGRLRDRIMVCGGNDGIYERFRQLVYHFLDFGVG
jgi:hypothetical protein